MNFKGVVFPGQGAQKLNMAMDFSEAFPEAAKVFSIAQQALDFDPVAVIQSDEEKLNLTPYTQPCIVAAEIAMYQVLVQQKEFQPEFFAGHSLGEYSALVAANVIPLDIALKIVRKRGQLMQDAMPVGEGTMAAVIINDLPYEEIKSITNEHSVDLANHNSLNQIVISGLTANVETVVASLQEHYSSIRCVMLNVSAPFHSRHMQGIAEPFYNCLQEYKSDYNTQYLPKVLSNYSGKFYDSDVNQLMDYLTKQLYSEVKWQENMQQLVDRSDNILELGPNRPLRGFFKAMGVNITAVCNVNGFNKLLADVSTQSTAV